METPVEIINRFKMVKKPGQSELISIQFKFCGLTKILKTFFTDNPRKNIQDIRTEIVDENGYSSYCGKYLVVIGLLSNIFGVNVYMTELLEDTDVPVKRLKIMGNMREVCIVKYLAKYLLYNELAFKENLSKDRPKYINPNQYYAGIKSKFYTPIIHTLYSYIGLREKYIDKYTITLRNKFLSDYCIKNFIFDFKDKNIDNPLYTDHDETVLYKFRVKGGEWKPKHLLWESSINK
jgi:hypothetical protein